MTFVNQIMIYHDNTTRTLSYVYLGSTPDLIQNQEKSSVYVIPSGIPVSKL
jgi:hypothetical protein